MSGQSRSTGRDVGPARSRCRRQPCGRWSSCARSPLSPWRCSTPRPARSHFSMTDESHLTFVAASGAGADQIVGLRLPVNRGIAGWVVSSGQPIGIEDVRSDARFEMDVAMSTGYVPTSILAVPIEGTGDTLGVIQLLDPAPSPDRQDMALLGLLSSHAALCVGVPVGSPEPSTRPARRPGSRRGGESVEGSPTRRSAHRHRVARRRSSRTPGADVDQPMWSESFRPDRLPTVQGLSLPITPEWAWGTAPAAA